MAAKKKTATLTKDPEEKPAKTKKKPAGMNRVLADLLRGSDLLERRAMKLDPGPAQRFALECAMELIEKAALHGASRRAVDEHRLVVAALQGRLDDCLDLVDGASSEAIGIVLAMATRESHRVLLDACFEEMVKRPGLLENPVTVANVLGELVSKQRGDDATKIALEHLARERDMTPVLYTNAIVAFAWSDETGPIAAKLAKKMERMLEREPEYFEKVRGSAHAWLALWYARKDDFASVVRHFERARELGYRDLTIMELHPAIALMRNRPELQAIFKADTTAAIDEKTRFIEKSPKDWWSVFSRGLLHHERGDLEKAEVDYARTIALNPDYADVYNNMGNIIFARGDHRGAIAWYEKSMARAPNLPNPWLGRAEARLHLGEPKAAVEDAEAILKTNAKSAFAHLLAALGYHQLEHAAKAKAHAKKGVALEPTLRGIDVAEWRTTLQTLAEA